MFQDLIKLIRQEQVSIFLGAGFSLKAGAPSCSTIVKSIHEAIKEIADNDTAGYLCKIYNLAEVSKEFVELCEGNRGTLYDLLSTLFDFEKKDLTDHILLSKVPHIKRIFTTNYDTLLEETYGSRATVIRNDNDVANLDNSKIAIFKIHGDFSTPQNIIITDTDYTDFFANRKNKGLWNLVLNEFLTQNILFIGYSLEDENILTLIKEVKKFAPHSKKKLFLIAPNLAPYKQKKLQKLDISYFSAFANEFLVELHKSLLDNITNDFISKNIAADTLRNFYSSNGIEPSIRISHDRNFIEKVHFTGEQRKIDLKIKTTKEILNKLSNYELLPLDLPKVLVDKIGYPKNTRGLIIEGKDLRKFNVRFNNVSIEDETNISKIMVMPRREKVDVKITVQGCPFSQKATFYRYNENRNTLRYSLANGLFSMWLDFVCDLENNTIHTTKITINENNSIEDLAMAKWWCKLLLAIWRGYPVKFKGICSEYITIVPNDKYTLLRYQHLEQYIDNLLYLESCDVDFKRYEHMTEQNFNISNILVNFLQEQYITENISSDIEFYVDTNASEKLLPSIGENYSFTTQHEDYTITDFNGANFHIPFVHEVYPVCETLKIHKLETGKYRITFKIIEPVRYIKYSKSPFNIKDFTDRDIKVTEI